MARLVCAGLACVDVVFDAEGPLCPGAKHRARATRAIPGGGALNATLAAAALDHDLPVTDGLVEQLREHDVTPHVAKKKHTTLNARTTRHPGYAVSLYKRMQVEKIVGWLKTVGGLRKSRFRGLLRNQMAAYLAGAAYNLVRIAKLAAIPT